LIEEFGIRPILAVIPENADPKLRVSAPDPYFWSTMCQLETDGATIALHGYRHLCESMGRSLLPLHRNSEFAGVAEEDQLQWIRAGLTILRSYELHPKLFVAPRHGFDRSTLRVLQEEKIPVLSDGFARIPSVRGGVTWIPQQLWGPVEKPSGLWTICIHSNTARSAEIEALREFLRHHVAQFTSVERVLAEFNPGTLGVGERIYARLALWRAESSHLRKRLRGRSQQSSAKKRRTRRFRNA
jgi:peptidoglycan/xylan/chitin deacetylase (PgdA/CDA1 family)